MSFSLPPEISVQRQTLDNGMVYQFRHKTLGPLGRIVLQDNADGLCQISSEVAGEPNDPMTETRAQIFEPLSQQLAATLKAIVRKGQQTVVRQPIKKVSPAPPKEKITSEQIRCRDAVKLRLYSFLLTTQRKSQRWKTVPKRWPASMKN